MDDNDVKLFGISLFQKQQKEDNKDQAKSFAPDINDDGAAIIENSGSGSNYGGGSAFAAYAIDLAGSLKNEIELIRKYRKMVQSHEADEAVGDICDEAIVTLQRVPIVEVDLENCDNISKKVKTVINDEFEHILRLLDFEDKGWKIFRQWYIDGRLYYHKILHDNQSKGIRKLKRIDPLMMKKVRETETEPHKDNPQVKITKKVDEYYVYNPKGIDGDVGAMGIRIAPEAVTFCHSGMVDEYGKIIVSHLHKAIRPLNQLRMIEDASVIYRIARAPERRIFYVDVGNLPTIKAEQYVRDIMNRYKNRLVYDASSGQLQSDRKHMHMLEDFFMPRREGGKGTEIDTLPGGQNLDQIEDIKYFQRLFYKALNVPLSRLEPEMNNSLSRGMEITRDELKFKKFIRRLQRQFASLFIDILETQLLLKKIVTEDEWKRIKEEIDFNFAEDSYFAEAKNAEVMRERMEMLSVMEDFIGVYYSREYVRKHILYQTDEEIELIDKQIEQEEKEGKLENPNDEYNDDI